MKSERRIKSRTKIGNWELPGGLVVKTFCFPVYGGVRSIPGWELRCHVPQDQETEAGGKIKTQHGDRFNTDFEKGPHREKGLLKNGNLLWTLKTLKIY